MQAVGSLKDAAERTSLSRRMVLLVVLLLAAALTLAGTLMVTALQRHLIGQIDRQLISSVGQIATQIREAQLTDRGASIPSEYFVRADFVGESFTELLTRATELRAGRPDITASLSALPQVIETGSPIPVTVPSTIPTSTWRAVSLPIVSIITGETVGVVTVALPLDSVNETLTSTAMSFMFAAVLLVALASLAGYYLVRRSLQPLRTIENVAGAIAAGDLSRRIPYAPPSTEVGSLASSLNSMLVQIERSFEAREESEQRMRRFVSDASHELRTPLAAIRGYGELYRMGGVDDAAVPDVIGRIEAESIRMGSLVEDLLTLARLDENPPVELKRVDLVEIVEGTRSDLQAIDPERRVEIVGINGQIPPKELMVEGEGNQIVQVFLNLAGNIVRYTPPGSPVEIAVGAAADRAVVEFRDHGPGIPKEDHSKVFERFYRTGKSRSRDLGGSGLGLSIVDSIVHAHGGEVTLWDTDPTGLTVRVTLPIRRTSIGSAWRQPQPTTSQPDSSKTMTGGNKNGGTDTSVAL